ncbi:hypothetical protein [Nitrososphaera sp.]|uniref:hypothetical protein n=1 Tax=Nitrososphaera sp. TaxID=1971748 RepID=UPI00307F8C6C
MTAENILDLYKQHPHGHFIHAWYEQACEVLGKAEADRTMIENSGWIELRMDANFLRVATIAKKGGKALQTRIKNIYRVRGPENKEYIFWSGQVYTENKHGEVFETSISKVGYGEIPKFKTTYDREEEEWKPSMIIQSTTPVYTIPFNEKEIARLEKSFYDKGQEHTSFYFVDHRNNKKHTISEHDWRTKARGEIIKEIDGERTSPQDTLKELTETIKKAVEK